MGSSPELRFLRIDSLGDPTQATSSKTDKRTEGSVPPVLFLVILSF